MKTLLKIAMAVLVVELLLRIAVGVARFRSRAHKRGATGYAGIPSGGPQPCTMSMGMRAGRLADDKTQWEAQGTAREEYISLTRSRTLATLLPYRECPDTNSPCRTYTAGALAFMERTEGAGIWRANTTT